METRRIAVEDVLAAYAGTGAIPETGTVGRQRPDGRVGCCGLGVLLLKERGRPRTVDEGTHDAIEFLGLTNPYGWGFAVGFDSHDEPVDGVIDGDLTRSYYPDSEELDAYIQGIHDGHAAGQAAFRTKEA